MFFSLTKMEGEYHVLLFTFYQYLPTNALDDDALRHDFVSVAHRLLD